MIRQALFVAFFLTVVRSETATVQDVTSRSVEKRFPDVLDLEVSYDDGERETFRVQRNPHFISRVEMESLSNNVVKRHANSGIERAEYISERAAIHATAEHDGERYRRSMSGLIYRRNAAYLLKPEAESRNKRDVTSAQIAKRIAQGPAIEERVYLDDELVMPDVPPRAAFTRRKYKKGTKLLVDVMSIIDHALYRKMKQQYEELMSKPAASVEQVVRHIEMYYGMIWAGIIQRYHDVRYRDMTVKPRLAKILIATTPSEDHWTWGVKSGDELEGNGNLGKLAEWMSSEKRKGRFNKIDHAMLFTSLRMYNIRANGEKTFAPVGLAFTQAICGYYSVSFIEEDLQLRTVGTAAHELGHSLGANHDGEPNNPSCSADNHNLMCPYVTNGNDQTFRNVYEFSRCSQSQFYEIMNNLNSQEDNCMTDDPGQDGTMKVFSDVLPGVRYDLHSQCRAYLNDKDSYYCGPNTAAYMRRNICHKFECFSRGRCQDYFHHHALHGTPCGDGNWCEDGECKRAPQNWSGVLGYYRECPVRDHSSCYRSSSVCNDPKEAEKCCNKCLKDKNRLRR